jgi:hypothetical protein
MDQNDFTHTLHLTNLDFDLTANNLYHFGNCRYTLGLNHWNESRGFAMVTFQYRDDAESFVNISINGCQVMICWARPMASLGRLMHLANSESLITDFAFQLRSASNPFPTKSSPTSR